MITVHHLEHSRSHRILWLLEELGADYEIEHYARDPNTMLAPESLYKIHPLGKSPIITDGGHTIAESGAIIEYLIDTYGEETRLRPAPKSEALLRYRYWLHAAEGSWMPLLVTSLVFRESVRRTPRLIRPIVQGVATKVRENYVAPNLERQMAYAEAELSDRPYFTGEELSGADVMMSYPVQAALRAFAESDFPKLSAFMARIRVREAWRRAEERGGTLKILSRD